MSLPNSNMDFTSFDILTAAELDNLVENIEALAAGTGLNDDSVTGSKIDFADTGAGAIWWEELGRTNLGGTVDTIQVNSFSNRKYLRVLVRIINSGSVNANLRLNSDSGNNYAYRSSINGAADGTATSQSSIQITESQSQDIFATIDIYNVSGQEALIVSSAVRTAGGAGNAPGRVEGHGKWTGGAITSIEVFNGSTGDYAAGSEVIILGHN